MAGGLSGCLGTSVREYESTPVAVSSETARENGFDPEPEIIKHTAETESDFVVREIDASITSYTFRYHSGDRGTATGPDTETPTPVGDPICVERVEVDGVNGFCEYEVTDLGGEDCSAVETDVLGPTVLLPCASEEPFCDADGARVQFADEDCTGTLANGTPRCSELLSGTFWVYCGSVETVTPSETPTETPTPTASPPEGGDQDDGTPTPTRTPTPTPAPTRTQDDGAQGDGETTPSDDDGSGEPGDTFAASSMPNPTVATQDVNPPANATVDELVETYTPVFEELCDCEVGDPDQIQIQTTADPTEQEYAPEDVGRTVYKLEGLGDGSGLPAVQLMGSEVPVSAFVLVAEKGDRPHKYFVMVARAEHDSGSDQSDTVYTAYVAERPMEALEGPSPLIGENGMFTAVETESFTDRFGPMAEDCGGTEVGIWPDHYHHCCKINPAQNGSGEVETNDLHVNVSSSDATKGPNGESPPSASSFPAGTITGGGKTLEFEEETVKKRGWVTVCWWSTQERDQIHPTDSGDWTRNGNVVAPVDVNNCD